MKKILISIERPETEITGIVRWRVVKDEHAARFSKEWDDAKVIEAFGLTKESERPKK